VLSPKIRSQKKLLQGSSSPRKVLPPRIHSPEKAFSGKQLIPEGASTDYPFPRRSSPREGAYPRKCFPVGFVVWKKFLQIGRAHV